MSFGVPYERLWCECGGNASATPHQIQLLYQVAVLHEEAQQNALWYVGVVLTLYVLGLVVVVISSGSSERHSALAALSFCCTQTASAISRRTLRT